MPTRLREIIQLVKAPYAGYIGRYIMAKSSEMLTQEVECVLEQLRQGIKMHGGDVELVSVDVEKGKVTVRLHGACAGCPYSDMTLKTGIEETLHSLIPEITEVVAVE